MKPNRFTVTDYSALHTWDAMDFVQAREIAQRAASSGALPVTITDSHGCRWTQYPPTVSTGFGVRFQQWPVGEPELQECPAVAAGRAQECDCNLHYWETAEYREEHQREHGNPLRDINYVRAQLADAKARKDDQAIHWYQELLYRREHDKETAS